MISTTTSPSEETGPPEHFDPDLGYGEDRMVRLEPPRQTKLGVVVFVALFHLVAILALIRAFAPEFTGKVAETVLSTFNVTVTAPEPSPTPSASETAGAAGAVGKKAVARPVNAPKPKHPISKVAAPQAASTGAANSSGAKNSGAGTGAGGQGNGTGTGGNGNGTGGGTKAVKIAGEINSARDYPADSRDARLGHEVIVYMTVGTDGRVRNCHVQKASPDPKADAITCNLAEQRFRFKPATDGNGNAIESVYGWRQRWFLPGEKN